MENLLKSQNENVRRFRRKPYNEAVEYSLSVLELNEKKTFDLKGEAIDISDEGICIQTDYPLETGFKLWLNHGIERAGTVRWCIKTKNAYRAGIKLEKREDYLNASDFSAVDNLPFVREEKEKYTRLLESATEQFIKKLETVENKCTDQNENPDELLSEVKFVVTDMMSVCEEYERGVNYDKSVIKNAQTRFRERTNSILSKSYFVNRARVWPQGYQGDYKTLEGIYKNNPLSEGIGHYLDVCFLNTSLAEAVRNRIKRIEEILREEISKKKCPSILNIACGSCRELMGLPAEIISSNARIVCVDYDNDAIAFAQKRLSYAGILSYADIYKYNALRMFDHDLNMMEFGMQDIIYSVGYFDYLPDEFLVKMLSALYKLLNTEGRLIAAFKDASRYRAQDYHWGVDWDGFLQRTKSDFDRLFSSAGIPESALSVTRDKSGAIVFYTAIK